MGSTTVDRVILLPAWAPDGVFDGIGFAAIRMAAATLTRLMDLCVKFRAVLMVDPDISRVARYDHTPQWFDTGYDTGGDEDGGAAAVSLMDDLENSGDLDDLEESGEAREVDADRIPAHGLRTEGDELRISPWSVLEPFGKCELYWSARRKHGDETMETHPINTDQIASWLAGLAAADEDGHDTPAARVP